MKPSLRQLSYVVAVADTGKFGDAARRLHVSQPSLSVQIAEIEADLGAALFERGRQGAKATPLGAEVAERARQILRDVEDLRAIVRKGEGGLRGRIGLGVLPTIGPYLLPPVVRELHATYPDLRLAIREERSVDLDAHLLDGRFDCVLSRPEDHPLTKGIKLFAEHLYLCTAREDPLSQSTAPILLSDLRGRTLLSLGRGHGLTAVIEKIATAAGAQVSTEYEGTSLDAIRQTSVMGSGVALLPSLYALTEARRDPDFSIRLIDDPLARREISLLWRETSPLARSFMAIGAVMKTSAREILQYQS